MVRNTDMSDETIGSSVFKIDVLRLWMQVMERYQRLM